MIGFQQWKFDLVTPFGNLAGSSDLLLDCPYNERSRNIMSGISIVVLIESKYRTKAYLRQNA